MHIGSMSSFRCCLLLSMSSLLPLVLKTRLTENCPSPLYTLSDTPSTHGGGGWTPQQTPPKSSCKSGQVLIGQQRKGRSPKHLLCSAAKTVGSAPQSGSQRRIRRQRPTRVQCGQTRVWTLTRRVPKGSLVSSLPPTGASLERGCRTATQPSF